MDFAIILYFFVGLLISGLSLPLMLNKIEPNHWYGIRLPGTINNEKSWYKVNYKFGKLFFNFGLVVSVLSAFLYYNKNISKQISFMVITFFLLIGVVLLIVKANQYSRSIGAK